MNINHANINKQALDITYTDLIDNNSDVMNIEVTFEKYINL